MNETTVPNVSSSGPMRSPTRLLPIPCRGETRKHKLEVNPYQPVILSPERKPPSEMTNTQLLRDPATLAAGMKYMNGMLTKDLTAQAVRTKLGVPLVRKKSWELSETSTENCRRSTRTKKPVDPAMPIAKSRKKRVQTPPEQNGDEMDDEVDLVRQQNERGDELFKELIKRTASAHSSKSRDYEAQKMQLDSMLNTKPAFGDLDPLYDQKKQVFDGRAGKIRDMSVRRLKRKFMRISPELTEIVDGHIECERRELFMNKEMKKLKEMNMSKPFDNDHGAALFSLLFDLIVDDETERPMWTRFINFVMLPETFIRIYALVNHISYDSASEEMRFGPLYEGPVRHF